MRILFFSVNCSTFHGKTLDERPLGGTETAVIRLAEALQQLGEEIYVVTSESHPPQTAVHYISPHVANDLLFDAVIVIRGWKGLFLPFKTQRRFFWTGDVWHNAHTFGIGDKRIAKRMEALFAVSDWHADTLCESSGYPRDKVYVLRNGIHSADFTTPQKRIRKRLIYSWTPERGLAYLPDIYLDLKERHPDVELVVYSSFDRNNSQWPPVYTENDPHEKLYERLKQLPDCTVQGSILQKDLAKEFQKASILAYPCDFEETSCISAMEAQAAGCVIVSTNKGALKETVGEAGLLLNMDPPIAKYRETFVKVCDRLLAEDQTFAYFSQKGIEQARHYDWLERAKLLLQFLNR